MKPIFSFLAGVLFCILVMVTFYGIHQLNRPHGEITNQGFSNLVVSSADTLTKVSLSNGESHQFEYGMYEIFIPDLDRKLSLFKNNDGSCTISQVDGIVVVQTIGLAFLDGP